MGFLSSALGANNSYQASAPAIQKQDLTGQITALNPQQQALTQQILNSASGQGPNPAAIALNQATNKSIQQTAGANASTQGISPALAARENAQNGAAATQQAAGQGALMQAQQQLAAQGLAANDINQQQSTLQNAQAQQNNAINSGTLGADQINAGVDQNNANAAGSIAGGLLGGAASALSGGLFGGAKTPGKFKGGVINLADGGTVPTGIGGAGYGLGQILAGGAKAGVSAASNYLNNPMRGATVLPTDSSTFNPTTPINMQMAYKGGVMHLDQGGSTTPPPPNGSVESAQDSMRKAFHFLNGGKVPAMLSPGEHYIPPQQVEQVLEGRKKATKAGKKVPGKAPVQGDSPKNDIVPAHLQPGGVVLPRSVVNAPNKEEKAKKFMEEIAAKKKPEGFGGVLKAKKHLESAHAALLKAHKAMKVS